MTLYGLRYEDVVAIRNKLPPGLWNKIRKLPKDYEDPESVIYHPEKGGLTKDELNALLLYKSLEGYYLQSALNKAKYKYGALKSKDLHTREGLDKAHRLLPHMDALINKQKIPSDLNDKPLYRGTRITYGTALIKSGKRPGDIIRDPRYQSFSLDPGVAMVHTATSQSGDAVTRYPEGRQPIRPYKPRRKVLLEHFAKEGETGLYLGVEDPELEVIYPRDKRWKIVHIRDDVVKYPLLNTARSVFDDDETYPVKAQNARIYTVERKKKKVTKKKPTQRKKIIKRKPVKKCRCKK